MPCPGGPLVDLGAHPAYVGAFLDQTTEIGIRKEVAKLYLNWH